MCGIVGYAGKNGNSLKVLIDGLHNLEYRGYDSSGIALIAPEPWYDVSFKTNLFIKYHPFIIFEPH